MAAEPIQTERLLLRALTPDDAEAVWAEWGFGYCLRRDRWGRGFATEIAKALLAFARGRGARAFVAECAQENPASARVMEKCGMVRTSESRFRKSGTDLVYPSYLYRLHLE